MEATYASLAAVMAILSLLTWVEAVSVYMGMAVTQWEPFTVLE